MAGLSSPADAAATSPRGPQGAELNLSGVVLAAGRSTRMGRDKALLEIDGVPMWRRQQRVLAGAGVQAIHLSARPEQAWAGAAAGFTAVLHDALPDCGPLIGITASLERARAGHVAVLAIDLPHMRAEWFRSLSAECRPGVGVVGRHGGYFEPLAAIYPHELKWLAWEAIAAGDYGLQRLLARAESAGLMRVRAIAPDEEPWFENWNRGAAAEAGLSGPAE